MSSQLTLIRPRNGRFPSFQRTCVALGQLPEFLFRALEFGTSQNRLFFETLSQNEPPRPHLREMIVRDQGRQYLLRNQFEVEEEPVAVGNEPLAALLLRCGPVQLRVLKSIDGMPPGCGDSVRRRKFYNQAGDLYLDKNGGTHSTRLNLLLLWNFDESYNLGQVWLTCPLRAGEKSSDVVTHFNEPLPHPAISLSQPLSPQLIMEQASDELEKLLLELEQEEAEDEGSKQA